MWNQVACGAQVEEDTRAFALGSGAVFESVTLAVIGAEHAEECSRDRPWCLCKVKGEAGLACVLDNSFHLFQRDVSEHLVSHGFPCRIEQMEWSPDGSFIYFGLVRGVLLALHIPSDTIIKLSKSLDTEGLVEGDWFFSKIISYCTDLVIDLLIVTTTHKIIRVYGACGKKLRECCEAKHLDGESKRSELSSIVSCHVNLEVLCPASSLYCRQPAERHLVVAESPSRDYLLIFYRGVVELWYFSEGQLELLNSSPLPHKGLILKAFISSDLQCAVCKLEEGELLFIDLETLERIFLSDDHRVLDISMVYSADNQHSESRLVAVVINEMGTYNLCIFTYPGFALDYMLTNIEESCLPVGLEDCIYYLELVGNESTDTVAIKMVVESEPSFRLQRLLAKGKFDEAEKFCRCFNLPLVELYKCKAKKLVDEISLRCVLTKEDISSTFNKLLSVLDDIQDFGFVLEFCVMSVPCTLELVEKLLLYAVSRLDSLNRQEQDNNCIQTDRLFDRLKLLQTFKCLRSVEQNSACWSAFSSSHFFKDCQHYISKGDTRSALVLCQGYWDEMKVTLTPSCAVSLLTLLPCDIGKSQFLSWLNAYLPLYLSLHPDSITLFNDWIVNTLNVVACVKNDLELCHELASEVLSILDKAFSNDSTLLCHFSTASYLVETIKILERFIYLKKEHQISLPFECLPLIHSKEEKMDMIRSIFDNVEYDNIEILIHKFLLPYCFEQSLRCDTILLEYIKSVNGVMVSEELWESRSIRFTDFIFNQQEKLEAVIYILDAAPVPWSETISSFHQHWFNVSTSEVKNRLSLIKKIVFLKSMLLKCGLPMTVDMDSIDFTRVQDIMLFIIKQNQSDNLEELFNYIKEFGEIFECKKKMLFGYSNLLVESLSAGRAAEAVDLLEKQLCEEDIQYIYLHCLDFLMDFDLWVFDEEMFKKVDVEALFSRIVHKLPENQLPPNLFDIFTYLKINYGVKMRIETFSQEEERLELSRICTRRLLDKDTDETVLLDQIKMLINKLEVPDWAVCLDLASQALHANKLEILFLILGYLVEESYKGTVIPADKVYDLALNVFEWRDSPVAIPIYQQLSILMSRSSLRDISTPFQWFVRKMMAGDMLMELVERREYMKPIWYSRCVYSDTVSQYHDTSQQTLADLSLMLAGESLEDLKPSQGLLARYLCQLPKGLQSILIAIRMLLAFEDPFLGLISEGEGKQVRKMIMEMVSTCLLKSVYSNTFDILTSLSLLFHLPKENALRWIDNVSLKTGQYRLHNLLLLGKTYSSFCDLPTKYEELSHFLTIVIWNRQFKHLGMSFDDIFGNNSLKSKILKTLMKLPNFDCYLLYAFCSTFSCDFQDNLLSYLKLVLTTWKLDYTVKDNELIVCNDDYHQLFKRCQHIVDNISMAPSQLYCYLLNNIWPRINPYYYEVYLVMVNLMMQLDSSSENLELKNKENLLNFLLSYRRTSLERRKESEGWEFEDEQLLGEVQTISKYRLPFRKLPSDPWDFIGPELTLESYKQWLSLPSWMGVNLPLNLICLLTIKNLRREECDGQGWDLQLKRPELLSKILECVELMTNLEIATKSLYIAVNKVIPPGADQVEMAQHCLFKAIEWKNKEDNSESRMGLAKAEKKYLSIKIRHILHKYNLAKPEYLNLIDQPRELFRALYSDSSIVDTISNKGVNEAVKIIADSSKMNQELAAVKEELLVEWLSVGPVHNQFVGLPTFQPEKTNTSDYVKRAVYMLGEEKDPIYVNILINSIFSHEDLSKPIQKKLRSTQILLSIVPHQELLSLTGHTHQQLTRFLQSCQFVNDLEQAGIVYAVNEFDSLPKDNIVQNLLARPSSWKCTVAAKLALAYNIKSPSLWNKIISYLHSFNQVTELEKCLIFLSKRSRSMIDMDLLVSAWSSVLRHHHEKVRRSGNSGNDDESLLLLSCPVRDKLLSE